MSGKIIKFDNLKEKLAPNYIEIFETEMKLCKSIGFTSKEDIVINALSYLDLKFSDSADLIENENMVDKYIDAIIAFYNYFVEKYAEDESIMSALFDENDDWIPEILSIGEDCVKGLVVNSWVEEYDNVDKNTKKKLDGLVSYIWNFRTYREIIVCTSDKQVLTMELHKNIPREEIEARKKALQFFVIKAYDDNAILLFRRKEIDNYIINGFDFDNCKILSIKDEKINNLLQTYEMLHKYKKDTIEKVNIVF